MNSLTGPGLILRRLRHLEQDLRLTILMRDHGKLSVVSKSSLRMSSKLKAVHEPFSEADYQIYIPTHGTHGRLTGGKLIDSHEPLRQRTDVFEVACRSCEAVEVLLPFRAPSPEVFDILRQTLGSLHTAEDPKHEWIQFVAELLKCLGHGDVSPQLSGLSRDKRFAFINEELKRILPWQLKSDLSPLTPLPAA